MRDVYCGTLPSKRVNDTIVVDFIQGSFSLSGIGTNSDEGGGGTYSPLEWNDHSLCYLWPMNQVAALNTLRTGHCICIHYQFVYKWLEHLLSESLHIT